MTQYNFKESIHGKRVIEIAARYGYEVRRNFGLSAFFYKFAVDDKWNQYEVCWGLTIFPNNSKFMISHDVQVTPQGKGYGSKELANRLSILDEAGVRVVFATVSTNNSAELHLLEKNLFLEEFRDNEVVQLSRYN